MEDLEKVSGMTPERLNQKIILCFHSTSDQQRVKIIKKSNQKIEKSNITMSVKIFFPKTKASPEDGRRRPTSIEIVVLLPAPLCPSHTIQNQLNKGDTYKGL